MTLLLGVVPGVVYSTTAAGSGKHTKKAAAKPQGPKVVGAAGLIAVARHQLEQNNLQAAVDYATSASAKAPVLDDYAQYIREQAEYGLKNYPEVNKSAARVFRQLPLSPLTGPAAALAVRAALDASDPKSALQLVKKYYDRIPQPQGDLLLARSFDATGDLPQAAEYYQRVYYNYPTAKEATDAANALVDVKNRLGDAYPPPMADRMLGRAEKLIDAKNPDGARIELLAAIPQLGGLQRDVARVRLGEVDYLSDKTQAAFDYLNSLKVDESEADAERLSYLIRCRRKLDRNADIKEYLNHLEQQHPTSPWRLDALVFVADQARVDNDLNTYLPLYQACAATFSKDPRAAWCHWRVAYNSYRTDGSDTYDLLRKHIETYPKSTDASNALYFLGRYEERKNELAVAKACYEQLTIRFPNTYYAMVARERLKNREIEGAVPDAATLQFLRAIEWPPRPEFPSFTPGEAAQKRITRAQLLEMTGLTDFAEGELKFGARNDGQQENVYAYQLARQAAARNAPDQAVRYIKAYVPNYLYMPLDQAPAAFWQLAFPLPFRGQIDRYSRAQSVDPYLIAALIRQESEFNVRVISYANAYGLMQVMPANGKELARHFGVRRMNASQLLTVDRNLQLGTFYFHNLLNSFGGQPELALASYNAGPSRANLWRTWGPFREQAEFIEAVPFHQTRGYIQIVLRNADVYRHLYASRVPDVPAYHPKPAPKTKPRAKRRRVHPPTA
ncbi:MAG TPA: transglycosylase SLT domain-containing protein [Bryobacteraceae bacterium]|nr:transglycosylase SLT domain-containing protein [Bryobacteraceae bacterium]